MEDQPLRAKIAATSRPSKTPSPWRRIVSDTSRSRNSPCFNKKSGLTARQG
jgi:hypothetical protein